MKKRHLVERHLYHLTSRASTKYISHQSRVHDSLNVLLHSESTCLSAIADDDAIEFV